MDRIFSIIDGQVVGYVVLALVPNLLLILWAMARLSREVRLLRSQANLLEKDMDLLDQGLSALSTEFQGFRTKDSRRNDMVLPPRRMP
jgi:ABC-type uncharacterized transport system permease subunit